ncbi:hypothetical protein QQZ08_012432 [Neonectria magnoliae]|uniref:Uncharacterized protein n=1 Tax=Neonectria magnoliae TaxID=2732573 RepID=A0ABR1H1Z5_9HYPO
MNSYNGNANTHLQLPALDKRPSQNSLKDPPTTKSPRLAAKAEKEREEVPRWELAPTDVNEKQCDEEDQTSLRHRRAGDQKDNYVPQRQRVRQKLVEYGIFYYSYTMH